MVNGDILDGITLLNGSYPQRYGNRLGAQLDFHMREGSRDRSQMRVGVSGTDASIVAEGPLGGRKAGSWLVSARKSYLELLLKQINRGRRRLRVRLQRRAVEAGLRRVERASSRARAWSPAARVWIRTPSRTTRTRSATAATGRRSSTRPGASRASPSFVLTQRVAVGDSKFRNTNGRGFELGRGLGPRPHVARRLRRDRTARRSRSKAARRCSGSTGSSSSASCGPRGASVLVKSLRRRRAVCRRRYAAAGWSRGTRVDAVRRAPASIDGR